MSGLPAYGTAATAALLEFAPLVHSLESALQEYQNGKIFAPIRTALPMQGGGILLSMPATSYDIAVHKLVSVCPRNAEHGMPTITGTVVVCHGETGQPEFMLDGPTVTGRRTAALSMLGVKLLFPFQPRTFQLVGTGRQARFHAQAISDLYPAASILVRGTSPNAEANFCEQLLCEGVSASPAGRSTPNADIVITATTSKTPIYREVVDSGRLVIAVGAFTPDAAEIAGDVVRGSNVYVDDIHAAKDEAGDLLQAGVDWSSVRPLSVAVGSDVPEGRPILLKTVGSAAWDLAACRVVRQALATA